MKKILFNLFLMGAASTMVAQSDVSFDSSMSTYTDLTGATIVNGDGTLGWDNPEEDFFTASKVTLPFTFRVLGKDYVTARITDFGVILKTAGSDSIVIGSKFDAMGRDNASSPISYLSEGTAPNRIFKIEWKNAGLFDEFNDSATTESYYNMQLWLHEDSKAAFHYGSYMIDYPSFDMVVGTMLDLNAFSETYYLDGNSTNYTFDYNNSQASMTDYPASGTVYTFTFKASAGVSKVAAPVFSMYPNPAANVVTFKSLTNADLASVVITDMAGRVQNLVMGADNTVNTSSLAAGVYTVQVTDLNGKVSVEKLIKN